MAPTHSTTPKANTQFAWITPCFKGLGQIMLQENEITGFLFLVGIFVGSFKMGIAVMVSVCVATFAANIFKYNAENINKGFYGFNAALIGAALVLLYKLTLILWCSIFIGAIASVVVQHFFITKRIPVFTLPFVVITWALFFLINKFIPEMKVSASVMNVLPEADFGIALRGYGQVIFQDNIIAGAIFFVGVFISSPIAALYGFFGAIIAVLIALPFSISIENIMLGLVSYNAVLCAIAFADIKPKTGIWVLLSIVFASAISFCMNNLPLPQFTFPFVAASCIVLVLKNISNSIAHKIVNEV